ncbi:MAG TPA: tail fiber protein [Candidatus Hydrogenedentes bacterium]|nr:tail fiber protein [Candidatus Hydrogenedentota bacterium]HOV75493.1 tail fiber protein [Candidatus Hydrogenedentota bacterium]
MRHLVAAFILTALVATGAAPAWAASVPDAMNYQGELTQPDGTPLPDGVYSISFRIYDANTGGNVIWGRRYEAPVNNGMFNVILGDSGGTALEVSPTVGVVAISSAFSSNTRYLGITIESDKTGTPLANPQEMLPRQQILCSPYAIQAKTADNATSLLNRVPAGTVLPFAGEANVDQPLGYLPCDGRAVERSKYSDLFAAIGTIWGSGDGTNTFNVPDLRGRVPMGAGQGSGLTERTVGAQLGEETHTLTIDEMPRHNHSYQDKYQRDNDSDDANDRDVADDEEMERTASTSMTGGDQPHNNIQPSAVVTYIIRY